METVIQLYTSLENYIDSLRETDIEIEGINLTKEKLYKKDTTRMIKRKVYILFYMKLYSMFINSINCN